LLRYKKALAQKQGGQNNNSETKIINLK